jgi:hypothetical protein
MLGDREGGGPFFDLESKLPYRYAPHRMEGGRGGAVQVQGEGLSRSAQ